MQNPSRKTAIFALCGVGLLLLIAVVVSVLTTRPAAPPTPDLAARTVTMDGGGEVASINLWDNYQTRGAVTGRAASGERVKLLQQSGAGCRVETSTGARGWVTCANFIREFK